MKKQQKRKVQTQGDIAARHKMRQKKRHRTVVMRRFTAFVVLIIICVFVIAFFTPAFNIKSVQVEGNTQVDSTVIINQSGVVEGQNLFKINVPQIKNAVNSLPYIKNVTIKRILFPPSLKINVEESSADAYIMYNGNCVLIDRNCNVLEETSSPKGGVPEITGLNLQNYSVGNKLNIDESDKSDIILLCIDIMEQQGILSQVNSIALDNVTDISFKYQNRLTIKCGSALDLDNKLVFFKSILDSGRLTDNSRGTIDISTSGQAIYTP